MNKKDLLQLNVVPDNETAWLNYDQYQALIEMFERVKTPSDDTTILDVDYVQLYDFLTNTAKLQVPMNEPAIHFNAFTLIRRGYKIEEVTAEEYHQLLALMADVDRAEIADMNLAEYGGHRALYEYLTQRMGLSVKAGRGPVWHRAKALAEQYQATHQPADSYFHRSKPC